MSQWLPLVVDLGIILLLFAGFASFRTPPAARRGNQVAAIALALAAVVVVSRADLQQEGKILALLLVGGFGGWAVAARVRMIHIPAMVAFQHGAGGVAAFLISFVELARYQQTGLDIDKVSGLLGLVLGAATFSGSLVAGGKLSGLLDSKPTALPAHGVLTAAVALLVLLLAVLVGLGGPEEFAQGAWPLVGLAVGVGWIFAARIGGADMPVLISFLNATAGVAAAFCGVITHNRLLVACGAMVAASGSILTHIMCQAMNRGLINVFLGSHAGAVVAWPPAVVGDRGSGDQTPGSAAKPAGSETPPPTPRSADPIADIVSCARSASRVLIVPGYGMAVAQAQFEVVELAKLLEEQQKVVHFAIHPVAGRMPGHMNVLLAEADAPYEQLVEMAEINPKIEEIDLAIVVGACDVVNPAARTQATSISGMPIVEVHRARRVAVCNLDDKPGYSGVANQLYDEPNVILLFGDAKETIGQVVAILGKAYAAPEPLPTDDEVGSPA